MVVLSDTITYPRAMMVHSRNAYSTNFAMMGPGQFYLVTFETITIVCQVFNQHSNMLCVFTSDEFIFFFFLIHFTFFLVAENLIVCLCKFKSSYLSLFTSLEFG
jgi:hypothetical protein